MYACRICYLVSLFLLHVHDATALLGRAVPFCMLHVQYCTACVPDFMNSDIASEASVSTVHNAVLCFLFPFTVIDMNS